MTEYNVREGKVDMNSGNPELNPETRFLIAIFGEKEVLSENDENVIIDNALVKAEILKVLSTLPEQRKNLILYEYGFLDETSHTKQEVAEQFHLSENELRRIESFTLRTLRHPSRSMQLKRWKNFYVKF